MAASGSIGAEGPAPPPALFMSLRTLAMSKGEAELIGQRKIRMQLHRQHGGLQVDSLGEQGTAWHTVPWEGSNIGNVQLAYDDRQYELPSVDEKLTLQLMMEDTDAGAKSIGSAVSTLAELKKSPIVPLNILALEADQNAVRRTLGTVLVKASVRQPVLTRTKPIDVTAQDDLAKLSVAVEAPDAHAAPDPAVTSSEEIRPDKPGVADARDLTSNALSEQSLPDESLDFEQSMAITAEAIKQGQLPPHDASLDFEQSMGVPSEAKDPAKLPPKADLSLDFEQSIGVPPNASKLDALPLTMDASLDFERSMGVPPEGNRSAAPHPPDVSLDFEQSTGVPDDTLELATCKPPGVTSAGVAAKSNELDSGIQSDAIPSSDQSAGRPLESSKPKPPETPAPAGASVLEVGTSGGPPVRIARETDSDSYEVEDDTLPEKRTMRSCIGVEGKKPIGDGAEGASKSVTKPAEEMDVHRAPSSQPAGTTRSTSESDPGVIAGSNTMSRGDGVVELGALHATKVTSIQASEVARQSVEDGAVAAPAQGDGQRGMTFEPTKPKDLSSEAVGSAGGSTSGALGKCEPKADTGTSSGRIRASAPAVSKVEDERVVGGSVSAELEEARKEYETATADLAKIQAELERARVEMSRARTQAKGRDGREALSLRVQLAKMDEELDKIHGEIAIKMDQRDELTSRLARYYNRTPEKVGNSAFAPIIRPSSAPEARKTHWKSGGPDAKAGPPQRAALGGRAAGRTTTRGTVARGATQMAQFPRPRGRGQ